MLLFARDEVIDVTSKPAGHGAVRSSILLLGCFDNNLYYIIMGFWGFGEDVDAGSLGVWLEVFLESLLALVVLLLVGGVVDPEAGASAVEFVIFSLPSPYKKALLLCFMPLV